MICNVFFISIAVRVIRAALNCSCPQEQPLLWSYHTKISDFGHELHKFSLQRSSLRAAQRHIILTVMEKWGWIWGIHGPSGTPFVSGKL